MEGLDAMLCREALRLVVADVKKSAPDQDLREAWVWKVGRNHWEFHLGEFYWHGSAANAYDARCNGWCAWLSARGVEGYSND